MTDSRPVLTAVAATAVLAAATATVALVVLALPAGPAQGATVAATPPSSSSPAPPTPPSSPPSPTAPPSPPPTVSGAAIGQVTGIPAVVPPGGTIHPTMVITQTTPYTLSVVPDAIFNLGLNGTALSKQDITLRMQDPVTGQWVDGEQEAVASGTAGAVLRFTFGEQFAMPPGGKLVLPFELAFGPAALLGPYQAQIVATVRVRDWPSTGVNTEWSSNGTNFLLGTPPPPPEQGKVNPYSLGGGGAAAGTVAGPATPVPTVSGASAPIGATPRPPSPIPVLTADAPQVPQVDADRVAFYRTRELPSVAGAVLASWLLLLGGYLRRVRRRRAALEPAGDSRGYQKRS
jgi:hypothetical protein